YDAQLASLLSRSFGTSDAYSRGLRAHGHDAIEVVANCAPLQLRWMAEHADGSSLRLRLAAAGRGRFAERARSRLLKRIVHQQAEAFAADVVYVQDTSFLRAEDLKAHRRGGRLVAGQLASPAPPLELLREY